MRKMYPKYKNIIADKDARTLINIATKLYDEGFKNVTMVVGSDRVKEFSSLLNTYNGVEGKRHGFYKFDNINVVSAENVTQMQRVSLVCLHQNATKGLI